MFVADDKQRLEYKKITFHQKGVELACDRRRFLIQNLVHHSGITSERFPFEFEIPFRFSFIYYDVFIIYGVLPCILISSLLLG